MLADEIYVLSPRPAVIKGHYQVPLAREEREPDALPLLRLEQQITAALIRD